MSTPEVSQAPSRPPVAKPKRTKLRSEESSSLSSKQTKAEKRAKRRKTDVEPQEIGEAYADTNHTKPKKEKKRKRDAEVVSEDAVNLEDNNEKKKKRTKKSEPESTTVDVVIPPKKRKNKTGFPDPNEDASLSEQSQKCLAYAFLQFHRPSKWKFNKARQNWLIRNIWSKEMVPEVHLPLLHAYLSKVQGGVRENLIQSCRDALEKSKSSKSSSDGTDIAKDTVTPTEPMPSANAATENTQTTRAQALIDLLGSCDPA